MTIARPSQGRINSQIGLELHRFSVISNRQPGSCQQGLRPARVQGQQNYRRGVLAKRAEALRVLPVTRAGARTSPEVKAAPTVKVRLCLQHQVPFGQVLKVVGAGPQFGEWQTQHAVKLRWTEGHVWTADLVLEAGSYEFKCIATAGEHVVAWEPGANRILQVPGGVRGILVEGSWSRTADSRVTVTEPISAASTAARQKRAAAARLLVKALEEVNAAAAATGPSAAALAGRRQAAGGGASASSPEGEGGSKAAAAAALEEEALRELKALLSPEPLGIFGNVLPLGSSNGAGISTGDANGRDSSSSGTSAREAKEGRLEAQAASAAVEPAGRTHIAGVSSSDIPGAFGSEVAKVGEVEDGAGRFGASAEVSAHLGANFKLAAEGVGADITETATSGSGDSSNGSANGRPVGERTKTGNPQKPAGQGPKSVVDAGIALSIREAAAARGEPLASPTSEFLSIGEFGVPVSSGLAGDQAKYPSAAGTDAARAEGQAARVHTAAPDPAPVVETLSAAGAATDPLKPAAGAYPPEADFAAPSQELVASKAAAEPSLPVAKAEVIVTVAATPSALPAVSSVPVSVAAEAAAEAEPAASAAEVGPEQAAAVVVAKAEASAPLFATPAAASEPVVPASSAATPAAETPQPPGTEAPAAAPGQKASISRSSFRFASLLGDTGGEEFASQQGVQEPGSRQGDQKEQQVQGVAALPAALSSSDASKESGQGANQSPESSARTRSAWRLLAEEDREQGGAVSAETAPAGPGAVAEEQPAPEASSEKGGRQAKEPAVEEEGASSRFARLLAAKQRLKEVAEASKQAAAKKTQGKQGLKQQPARQQPLERQPEQPEEGKQASAPGQVRAEVEQDQAKDEEKPAVAAAGGEKPKADTSAAEEKKSKRIAQQPAAEALVLAVSSDPQSLSESPVAAVAAAPNKEPEGFAPSTPGGRDTRSGGVTLTAAAAVAAQDVSKPTTVRGSGISSNTSAVSKTATGGSPDTPVSSTNSSSVNSSASTGEVRAVMGASASRPLPATEPEDVTDTGLDRLLEVWDAAWSEGSGAAKALGSAAAQAAAGRWPGLQQPQPPDGSSGPVAANGGSAGAGVSPGTPTPDVSQPGTAAAAAAGLSAALNAAAAAAAAAGKLVNGGAGESLFSLAERLTANGPAPPAGSVSSDETSSPGITMRSGAMAAMGVDRQGSYDSRSSYLSQSLPSETGTGSLSTGGAGADSSAASALLRQLRSASAAAAASASAATSALGASVPLAAGAEGKGKPAANGAGPFPPLPATPAPPGILASTDEEDGEVVPPRLPATPPPPSYLAGPPPTATGPVPPLPATPVPPSVLAGSLGGAGRSAEDLLRRAADADAVMNMLRGNLPLTPVARGGSSGPLSAVEDEEEENGGDARGGAGGRARRSRRGASLQRGSAQTESAEAKVDVLAANRAALVEAVQAWEKARAALEALQQSAATLGLSPAALSNTASRILQQLPKLDAATLASLGQGLPMLPPPGAGGAADGDAAGSQQQPSAAGAAPQQPGLPASVTQIATSLVTGLGTVGSSLTEQLRRVSGAAVEAVAAPVADGRVAEAAAAGAAGASGLISSMLSSLVGSGGSALPPGCLRLVAGAHMIPHVDKVEKGGEDAYFISRVALGGVGVADGVSGWADEGIDPAEYPRTLMRYASDAFESARGTLSATDIIRYAQYRTYLKGSSTVCMALMKPGRLLEVANVGDSGVRILRGGKVMFGTEAQQHAFNMPFQLSHPNNVEDPDSADDADVHMVEVQEGDVVMLATDGLFDNVFDEEIEAIVSAQLQFLASQGRGAAGKAAAAAAAAPQPVTVSAATGAAGSGGEAAATAATANGTSSIAAAAAGGGGSRSGGSGGSRGLLALSLAAAGGSRGSGGAGGGSGGSGYREEDAVRIARALAERAHQHARNPTQRTPWSVTSSQQPNFMWAKFFAKGGGKMDDCTVLVAFVCGPE